MGDTLQNVADLHVGHAFLQAVCCLQRLVEVSLLKLPDDQDKSGLIDGPVLI